jgi:hypothetical protein
MSPPSLSENKSKSGTGTAFATGGASEADITREKLKN